MSFLRRSLLGVFLLAMTFGLVALAGQTVWNALQARWAEETPQRPARERIVAVNVIAFELGEVTPELTTFGEVQSRRTLDLRASSGGAVVWLSEDFETGGTVASGDLLARIDPADAQSALDVARADLSEAEADLRDAERTLGLARDDLASSEEQARLRARALERQRDLLERGVGTEAAVEAAELSVASAGQAVLSRRQAVAQAESRIDQANTTIARREIALAEAERRLADTEIRAEFAGVLADVSVVEGGLVSPNERLARLIDPDALEVAFRVSTSQYARLLDEEGRLRESDVRAGLDVMGADISAQGKISRESAAVGEGQTGRLIFARLDGAAGFRPGDFVTVTVIEEPLRFVARLPATAVDAAGMVLVVGDEDRLRSAEVEVLRRQGNDVIVRARGLAGERIVAERTPLLGTGIKVRPIEHAEAGGEAPAEPEMIALDPERRARLVAFVEGNRFMPDEAKQRVLATLQQDMVPAQVIERIESRMGG